MTSSVAEVQSATVSAIGSQFMGVSTVAAAGVVPAQKVEPFEFDEQFQTKIAGHVLRDTTFMREVGHLIKPEYFESVGEAYLVNMAVNHFKAYGEIPSKIVVVQRLKDDLEKKVVRGEQIQSVKAAFKDVFTVELDSGRFVAEKCAEFARHQAVSQAILDSVDLIGKGRFDKIEDMIRKAVEIGIQADGGGCFSYFESVADRTTERIDKLSGKTPARGITTGVHKLDDLLYHKGWGRREMVSIMGGPKSGKTTALINFGRAASLAGHNVVYFTLEVGAKIIMDRLDASVTETAMRDLMTCANSVKAKVETMKAKAGRFEIQEYGSGTCTPNMIRAWLEKRKADGIIYDLVIVDYADIMAPNHRTNEPIENSKSIYVDLRAVAFEFDCAVLTATQTNREGHKATVAKMEHVSEDFNKVRIVDLMITINITEEERSKGECRLYFAASRNQEAGFTIVIKQRLECMRFIESVLRVE